MIGLVSYSPASVNIMNSLYRKKDLFSSEVVLFLLSDYSEVGYEDLNYFTEINKKTLEGITTLIYNTGSGGKEELLIPKIVKEINKNIKVIAINDIFWDSIEGLKNRYKEVPDKIIALTEECKKKLLEVDGVSEDNIVIIGNPYFDRLNNLDVIEDRDYLSVSFISQCASGGTYEEDTSEECKNSFYELMELLNEGIITDLYIYKHPRETGQFYLDNGFNIEKTNDFLDMMRSGIIVSCGSTPHYEAMMIGKRTLFSNRDSMRERIIKGVWDNAETKIDLECTEKVINFINNL